MEMAIRAPEKGNNHPSHRLIPREGNIKNLSVNNIPPFAKGGWGDFPKVI
jgi:hypothetical protein